MAEHIDVFVIGGGTAGNAASRAVAAEGLSVAVAEPDKVGGTCLWHGCIPKKALFNSAMAYRDVQHADEFGVLTSGVELDWPSVLAWKWHSQETYAGDQEDLMASRGIRHLTEAARFLSSTEVIAGQTVYEPDAIVVATGSHAIIPPIPGAELADISDDALRYPELPESLVIIGAGYIAMEFAGIYASFGTAVTVLVRDTVLTPFDQETVAIAIGELQRLGAVFIRGASVTGITGMAGDLTVEYTADDGVPRYLPTQRVLMATGRRANLDDLGLDAAGIERDRNGRPALDSALRSTNQRVWFAGDATGLTMLTPIASVHGSHVARSIITGQPQMVDTSAIPSACFTVPELAQVGLTEAQATQRGIVHRVLRGTLEYVGAAIITDRRTGFIKVVIAEDGTVLGAHIVGRDASDLIYTYALAVRTGSTIAQIAATRAIHPALSEAINWTTG
ncbi:MAG: NAD(P)/FAD-dependent oxidoreductase [Coriobacteriia bacterium]|nr:NAD(P)/FAD-dependent oxidoreductase [Coriobacteriia bacterium]